MAGDFSMRQQRVLLTDGCGLLALDWACTMRGQSEMTLSMHRHGVRLSGVDSMCLGLSEADTRRRQSRQIGADL